MLEDTLLRHKFNRGNKRVLPRIYEKYKHELVTLATALLHDKYKAEDTVHDVFAKLLEPQQRLIIKQNLKGYLTTAVANKARSSNRSSASRQTLPLKLMNHTPDSSPPAERNIIFGEEKEHLINALALLPYQQREVILLKIFSGLKFKTIAKSQNVSINTVQGRYRYGLEKLRTLLNGELKWNPRII